jgi:hypothetical protein
VGGQDRLSPCCTPQGSEAFTTGVVGNLTSHSRQFPRLHICVCCLGSHSELFRPRWGVTSHSLTHSLLPPTHCSLTAPSLLPYLPSVPFDMQFIHNSVAHEVRMLWIHSYKLGIESINRCPPVLAEISRRVFQQLHQICHPCSPLQHTSMHGCVLEGTCTTLQATSMCKNLVSLAKFSLVWRRNV